MKSRLFVLAIVALMLALTRPACGQVRLPDASDRFAWKPSARPAANVLSDVTLGLQVALDTIHSIRGDETKRDLWRQACSFGLSQGVTLVTKQAFRQRRPDGSDYKSTLSGHAASAAQGQGWNWSIGIPLTALTGWFRIGAGKHDVWNVVEGAAVGTGARWACGRLIK